MKGYGIKNALIVIAASIMLAACGGSTSGSDDNGGGSSGGSGGSNPGGGGSNGSTQLDLIASARTLPSAAVQTPDGIELTAILRDANNNAVSADDVTFSADAGRLEVGPTGAGAATATLFNDPDRANRTITVKAASSGVTDQITIDVVGTGITLTGPEAIATGEKATYTARLSDSSGAPVSGATVDVETIPSATVGAASVDTNNLGEATFEISGQQPGENEIRVSSRGAESKKTVQVGGQRLAFTSPDANSEPPTVGDVQSVTVVYSDDNGPIANAGVSFSLSRGDLLDDDDNPVEQTRVVPTTAQGEASTRLTSNVAGDTTVTASINGKSASRVVRFAADTPVSLVLNAASSTLTPGQTTNLSATIRDRFSNPVANKKLNFRLDAGATGTLSSSQATTDRSGTARVGYTAGPSSASEPVRVVSQVADNNGVNDATTITIAGEALSIRLGTGGPAKLSPDGTTYDAPYAALISDAAGNPVPGASLRVKLRAVRYQASDSVNVDCPSEDRNKNGILDNDEDKNGNDKLDPGQVATVPSSPTLDDSGVARFNVTYLSQYATRVEVELAVTADAAGSEGSESQSFVLDGTASGDNPFTKVCTKNND